MARASSGSIDQVSPGRWRVRVTLHGKRTTFGTYESLPEAEMCLQLACAELKTQATEAPAPDNSFGSCCVRWLEARAKAGHVTEPHEELLRFKAYIQNDPIAQVPIHLVSRAHVVEWVDRVRLRVRANTARNALQIVRGTLGKAYDSGRIKVNPATDIKIRRDAVTSERVHISLEEQRALITAAGERWAVVAFAIGTGLRSGEQCALRMRDVSEEDGRITVSRGSPDGRQTKTKRTREVFVMGPAVDALKHQLAMRKGAGPDEPLFPGRDGGFRPNNLLMRNSTFKAIVLRAGISRDFRWHDLRHAMGESLASGYWGEAVDLHTVATQMGHSRITMTQKYSHLSLSALRAAAKKVNAGGVVVAPETKKTPTQLASQLASERGLDSIPVGNLLEVRMGLEPTYAGFANLRSIQNSHDVPAASGGLANSLANSEPSMASAFVVALLGMVETAAIKDGRGYGMAALNARMAVVAATAGTPDDGVAFAAELLRLMAGASGAGRGDVGEKEVV